MTKRATETSTRLDSTERNFWATIYTFLPPAAITLLTTFAADIFNHEVDRLTPASSLSQSGTIAPGLQEPLTNAIVRANFTSDLSVSLSPVDFISEPGMLNYLANIFVILGLGNLAMAESKRAALSTDNRVNHGRLMLESLATLSVPPVLSALHKNWDAILNNLRQGDIPELVAPALGLIVVAVAAFKQCDAVITNMTRREPVVGEEEQTSQSDSQNWILEQIKLLKSSLIPLTPEEGKLMGVKTASTDHPIPLDVLKNIYNELPKQSDTGLRVGQNVNAIAYEYATSGRLWKEDANHLANAELRQTIRHGEMALEYASQALLSNDRPTAVEFLAVVRQISEITGYNFFE